MSKNNEVIDITGTILTPGKPEQCAGNGNEDPLTCCCDECDYFLKCFPEWEKTLERRTDMRFRDDEHRQRYLEIIEKMGGSSVYHSPLAYLFALDTNINDKRLEECFDFEDDSIKPGVLEASWITGTDRRTLQLAFNLWNDSNKADVADVFGYIDSENMEYLFEAVRIRFETVDL